MARHARRKREEARKLYLTGEATTVAEIARRLTIKPHTVGLWKREEQWDELRLKVDRLAADRLVDQLAGERVKLNARHFKFWDVIGSKVVELVKGAKLNSEEVKSLDRLAAILDRMQKGQRLARGMSLDGQTEEQLRAQAEAEGRSLVDAFMDIVKKTVPDEDVRDQIARVLFDRTPMEVDGADESGGTA